MLLWQAEAFAGGIDKFHTGFPVRLERSGDFRDALADEGVGDDELWPAVIVLLRGVERVEERLHVLAVDLLDIEAVGLEPRGGVLALARRRRRIEGDGVRIVNQDQIIEPEMPGEGAGFGRNAFLQTTVAREANAVLIENAVVAGIETRRGHFHRHRDADGIGHALPQRAGGAFDSRRFKKFRMARRLAVQLTEVFDFLDRQIVAAHVQPGVEEHAAVTGGENEIVTVNPARLVRVVFQHGDRDGRISTPEPRPWLIHGPRPPRVKESQHLNS